MKNNVKIEEEKIVEKKVRAVIYNPNTGNIAIGFFNKTKTLILPGGGIEEDELPLNALIREVREETGITAKEINIKSTLCKIKSKKVNTYKTIITTFYLVETFANFDESKMELSTREIEGGYHPHWKEPRNIRDALKEIIKTIPKDKHQELIKTNREYERFVRNAEETIEVLNKFLKYLKNLETQMPSCDER